VKRSNKTIFPFLIPLWFCILLILNVIPIGNDLNKELSGNKILEFRIDYLVHSLTILCFAWLNLVARSRRQMSLKLIPFSLLVLSSAALYELVQYFIPWRSFNPVDMFYGYVGAALAILFVWLDGILHKDARVLSNQSKPELKISLTDSQEIG